MTPVGQPGIKIFPGREVYNRGPRPRGEKKNGAFAISPRPSPSLSFSRPPPPAYVSTVPRMGLSARIPYNADNL